MPDLKLTSISDNVASSIIGNNCKRECAAKLSTNNMDYSEQRFVLSRLMGRNDLSDYQSWIRSDMRDSSGNPYDIRKDLSLEMQKEVELGRRKPADLCWVMSQECWMCEMWSYYLPIISKQDIAESYGGLSKSLCQLNDVQEKVFEKMIATE